MNPPFGGCLRAYNNFFLKDSPKPDGEIRKNRIVSNGMTERALVIGIAVDATSQFCGTFAISPLQPGFRSACERDYRVPGMTVCSHPCNDR